MKERGSVATGVLIAVAVIGILGGLYVLYRVRVVIVILLLSAVVATGIAPLVEKATKLSLPPRGWHLPRGVGVILVYILLIVVLGGLITVIGTVVVREGLQFAANSHTYYASLQEYLGKLHAKYSYMPDLPAILERIKGQIGQISAYLYQSLKGLFGFASNIVVLLTTFVIVFYMITAEHSVKESILKIVPPSQRERFGDTFTEMGVRMGSWLRAQIFLAFIVGALVSLGLWIIGIPYALIIGITGGIAEMLPMVGPGVAAIPAIGIALFSGQIWRVVVVVIFFVLLSQLESNVLFPKIMSHHVGLSPMLTILALIAGATLGGFLGALLAIPLTAALQVFFQRIIFPAIENAQRDR
jgi:predicted PurR-regulated permease PerM